ncbi:MAG TPA: glycosyltransferase family 4 protein [Vicinamibacterales bacterium]|jgi:glycosyltransferase involved in cell wall biosynthesis|nr:glycosyltransferase family 4 protein [Vicinamibacterales bacterium]
MKLLVGTVAYNPHVQNMALALHEAGALQAYMSAGVDAFHAPALAAARRVAARWGRLDRELSRRRVSGIPVGLVRSRWRWELPRTIGSRLRLDDRLVDWCWERSELDLDRTCAAEIAKPHVDGFLGVEHGALGSLRAAREQGKPGLVAFLSPHHRTLARAIEPEYDRFPALRPVSQPYFERVTARRDERRDREALAADWIVSNSSVTTRSLVEGGVPSGKILTVPLGGPSPVAAGELPRARPAVTRVLFVGSLSVRKGAHYLLRVWPRVARPGLELHCYGSMILPDRFWREAVAAAGGSIHLHGSVPAAELRAAYLGASVLVLPTLCDGFGMVVSEALAHGLPVVTTRNAGAADAIDEGRTGWVVPAADEEALASALAWAADHPDALFAMRRAALDAAATATWTDYRRSLWSLLARALGLEPERLKAPA